MEGNGNHLYTMDKILAFIIFSQNDRWHIHYHFSSYFAEKERTLSNFTNSDFSPRMLTTLRNIDFLEKFGGYWWLWCLKGMIRRPQPNKICLTLTPPSNLSPGPDMMLSWRHINYIIVGKGGGTSLQNLGLNFNHC